MASLDKFGRALLSEKTGNFKILARSLTCIQQNSFSISHLLGTVTTTLTNWALFSSPRYCNCRTVTSSDTNTLGTMVPTLKRIYQVSSRQLNSHYMGRHWLPCTHSHYVGIRVAQIHGHRRIQGVPGGCKGSARTPPKGSRQKQ